MTVALCRSCKIEKSYPSDFRKHRRVCTECYRSKSLAYYHMTKARHRRSISVPLGRAAGRIARYRRLLSYFDSRRGWYETILQMFLRVSGRISEKSLLSSHSLIPPLRGSGSVSISLI